MSGRRLRDATTFLLGAVAFLHELLFTQAERPFLLTASLALMGFPFVLGVDSKLRKDEPLSDGDEADRWSHLP